MSNQNLSSGYLHAKLHLYIVSCVTIHILLVTSQQWKWLQWYLPVWVDVFQSAKYAHTQCDGLVSTVVGCHDHAETIERRFELLASWYEYKLVKQDR